MIMDGRKRDKPTPAKKFHSSVLIRLMMQRDELPKRGEWWRFFRECSSKNFAAIHLSLMIDSQLTFLCFSLSRMWFAMLGGSIADGGGAAARAGHRLSCSRAEIIARETKSKGNRSRRGAAQVPHHQTDWRCSRFVHLSWKDSPQSASYLSALIPKHAWRIFRLHC